MKSLGIAGGSGSGKSTVAYGLESLHPDTYSVLSLDNYQRLDKHAADFPTVDGMPNWDHPDVVQWDRLRTDVLALKAGQTVTASVWRHPQNPDFHVHKKFLDITVEPREVLIVEGHFALHDQLADLYDAAVFLDLKKTERIRRRLAARADKGFSGSSDAYMEKVLIPMHERYIEPTRHNATDILNVDKMRPDEVVLAIHGICQTRLMA